MKSSNNYSVCMCPFIFGKQHTTIVDRASEILAEQPITTALFIYWSAADRHQQMPTPINSRLINRYDCVVGWQLTIFIFYAPNKRIDHHELDHDCRDIVLFDGLRKCAVSCRYTQLSIVHSCNMIVLMIFYFFIIFFCPKLNEKLGIRVLKWMKWLSAK